MPKSVAWNATPLPTTIKPVTIPKSMGKTADLLFDVREARLAADKYAALLKTEETRITNHVIDNLSKKDDTGAAGQHHRVQVKRKQKFRVNPEKWPKLHAWIAKTGRFDLLQKRISDEAITELMTTAPKKAQPPGVEPFDYVTVSLTKV